MTHAVHQVAALALSVVVTLGAVAGIDSLATQQYAAADTRAMSDIAGTQVAVQHVTVVGHRANA